VVLVLAAVLATIEVGADFGVETIGRQCLDGVDRL
jgi:hypothetical protein